MDNDTKLFEGLLKTDGIDPKAPTESERLAFKKMLDSEQKRMNRLCWYTNSTLFVFLLAMLGLCLSENILEALRIPFYVGCFVIAIAMLFVMIKYMPSHNRKMKESGRKIRKLHYLVYGRHRGFAIIGKKNGKRVIHWPSLLILIVVMWVAMSLAGAGVFYLLCRRWVYSSEPILHIIYCTLPCLSLVIFAVRDGFKTPLDELVEINQKRSKPGLARSDIWRLIMKSKITKFAAVTAIIIAVVLALQNGAVDIVSPAFGVQDMLDAMRKVNWTHGVLEVVNYTDANNAGEIPCGGWERWMSVNLLLSIEKHIDGNIYVTDANTGKKMRYDPGTNKITVEYVDPSSSQQEFANIGNRDMIIKQYTELEKQGAEIKYEDSILDGEVVTVISINFTSREGLESNFSLIVDPQTYLPKGFTGEQKLPTGQHATLLGTIDYPETGPTDIYQAGAPRNAEVVIIDNPPNP
jgi:hypothetical protein